MWSVQGQKVVHQSGLIVEILAGSFSNPMDLAVKGNHGLSAPEVALLIREGLEYAASQTKKAPAKRTAKPSSGKAGRPILKLKK